jgi:hypothetical protein
MTRTFLAPIACVAASLACAAHAEITQLNITSTQPFGDFSTGRYVRIEAEARGTLAPNEAIPDSIAPRETRRGASSTALP